MISRVYNQQMDGHKINVADNIHKEKEKAKRQEKKTKNEKTLDRLFTIC